MADQSSLISVVVPARNEERWIGECLGALRGGSTPRDAYEVILVDNGSTDRTVEIARPLVDRVLEVEGENVSRLRNRGVAAAGGQVIAFLDADCIPAADWLEAGLRSLGHGGCITGATYLLPDDPAPVEALWFSLEPKPEGREQAGFVPAGNLFVRRRFFDALGGFDEGLEAGEDKELCARAARSGEVFHDPSIRVVHRGNPKTFRGLFRRELWHGRGVLRTLRRNPGDRLVLATLLFVAGAALALLSIPLAIFSPPLAGLSLLAGLGTVGLVIAVALLKHRRRLRGIRHTFWVVVLYLVYFSGRGLALLGGLCSVSCYHHLTAPGGEAAATGRGGS